MSDTSHRRNLPVPFFSQREVKYRWQRIARGGEERTNGQGTYASGDEIGDSIPLASSSCNIVSLCMLLHYYGITDDSPYRMLEKFFEITQWENIPPWANVPEGIDLRHVANGHTRLTHWWALKQFPRFAYGLQEECIQQMGNVSLSVVERQIERGNPVMFSYGAVHGSNAHDGHIAVIRGFTEDNHVIINDPWGDVATPDGFLISRRTDNAPPFFGRFHTTNIDHNRTRNYFGLGNGDNSVLHRDEFNRLIQTNHRIWQVLYINYPHKWSFPFRRAAEDRRETTFRFSDHTGEARADQDNFREERVRDMLRSEIIENAGYPISTNRMWHDGIHIEGNGSVYAIGPGRLIAARIQPENGMPRDDGSNNFVLVRHQVRIGNNEKQFYSHYMHLAPVDIAGRIRDQLAGTAGTWDRDWIDQLIERIKPKRAISNSRSAIRIFRRDGQAMTDVGHLPLGTLIHLRPEDAEVRNRIEAISPNEELQQNLSWFYNAVNTTGTYVHNHNGTEYFAFYHRTTGTGNAVAWEIRYAERNDAILIPQVVNIPDFIYSRRILARLLRGDVTFFEKENIDTRELNRVDNIEWYKRSLLASFANVDFDSPPENESGWRTSDDWGTVRNAIHGRITRHYERLVTETQDTNALPDKLRMLTESVVGFGRALLTFPANMLYNPRNAFTLNGNWYAALGVLYREILVLFSQRVDLPEAAINEHLACFKSTMISSVRANIDYHIEVNGNTKLGLPGLPRNANRSRRRNRDSNIIHFEIFSDTDNLIPYRDTERWSHDWEEQNRRFVRVPKSTQRNDFFNVRKIIENMRTSNFLMEPRYFIQHHLGPIWWVREDEINNFLRDSHRTGENVSLQYAVVQHLHSYAELSGDIWEQIRRSHIGMNSILSRNMEVYLSYKWFSAEIVNKMNPPSNSLFRDREGVFAIFYHPVRFLAWLDAELIRTANNPAPAAVTQTLPAVAPVPTPPAHEPVEIRGAIDTSFASESEYNPIEMAQGTPEIPAASGGRNLLQRIENRVTGLRYDVAENLRRSWNYLKQRYFNQFRW